ncbi:MAG: 50S ribosomal protein L9 [Planctomycetes bacterium]|nr:50S ribosomal protein L9 [Planctomycetota bacterium]
MIEILLRSNVADLGKIGEIVKVRDGYARNYLFPNGLAVGVTEDNKRAVEKMRTKYLATEAERAQSARALAAKISALTVQIAVKTNEEGRMYGSVTANMIADALSKQGFKVGTGAVKLKGNIEEIGHHDVPVHLHAEVDAQLKLIVTAQ